MHKYAVLSATGIPLMSGLPLAALIAEAMVAPYDGRPVPILLNNGTNGEKALQTDYCQR